MDWLTSCGQKENRRLITKEPNVERPVPNWSTCLDWKNELAPMVWGVPYFLGNPKKRESIVNVEKIVELVCLRGFPKVELVEFVFKIPQEQVAFQPCLLGRASEIPELQVKNYWTPGIRSDEFTKNRQPELLVPATKMPITSYQMGAIPSKSIEAPAITESVGIWENTLW